MSAEVVNHPHQEIARLKAELVKAERRAIMFGDVVSTQCIAMQAAVIDGRLGTPARCLEWIMNTLQGPGLLPNLEEAHALGGAQAWFDKKMAEHDAFRAANPAPDAELAKEKAK